MNTWLPGNKTLNYPNSLNFLLGMRHQPFAKFPSIPAQLEENENIIFQPLAPHKERFVPLPFASA